MIFDLELLDKITPEDLALVRHRELIAMADIVGRRKGVPIVKAGHREAAAGSQMADEVADEYEAEVEDELASELEDLPENPNPGQVETMVNSLGERLAKAGIGAAAVNIALRIWARTARTSTGQRAGLVPGSVTIRPSLSQRDERAIESLNQQTAWWIGDFWTSHLGQRISDTVAAEMLQRGLGREDVGRIIRGMLDGSFPGVRVPGTYTGSSREYFRMLAGVVRNQASNASAAYAADDAGIERLEIVAVLDERTSEICGELDGKIIPTEVAVGQADKVTRSGDPNSYLQSAAWRTIEDVEEILGRAGDVGRNLGAEGLGLPPYHANCRTIVIPAG